MNIALFALAVVMIVGGIASVIQGFPFVRLESGLAMTIAGATTASAGAVLLGIAVVATRLRNLERAFAERDATAREALSHRGAPLLQDQLPGLMTDPVAPEPVADDPMSRIVPMRQRPSLAGVGPGAGVGLGVGSLAGLSATRSGAEPTFAEPPEPAEAEPLLPDLLPPEDVPEPRRDLEPAPEVIGLEVVEHEAERLSHTETDLFAPSEPPSVTVEPPLEFLPETPEHPIEDPALETVAMSGDEAPAPSPPLEEAPEVVGTYSSGGNTYVMFSNGSIEAETPRGRYTFASLDELKVFVESGGESDARGAA